MLRAALIRSTSCSSAACCARSSSRVDAVSAAADVAMPLEDFSSSGTRVSMMSARFTTRTCAVVVSDFKQCTCHQLLRSDGWSFTPNLALRAPRIRRDKRYVLTRATSLLSRAADENCCRSVNALMLMRKYCRQSATVIIAPHKARVEKFSSQVFASLNIPGSRRWRCKSL